MAKSNKPIVWGLFAAGGTVTAFITPVLVLLTLLPVVGVMPELLVYDNLHAFAGHWVGKLLLFGVIFLVLWHAAHRLRITLHDFGVRADSAVAVIVYLAAAAGTLAAAYFLLRI
ncbi:MAG: fumarate reductase subunit D [Betaproteobacteria bacterium]|jgi:fumarate reductase subunit D|nr:fumarate reductase subunit D [Betaproteobacteria bacterium]MDH5342951.1 fumarate reductase subunit D [Betaproteobacteria bacterium]